MAFTTEQIERAKQGTHWVSLEIFAALDAVADSCWDQTHHPGIPEVHRRDCPHEMCWIGNIMES
jgi:hypothetical protein